MPVGVELEAKSEVGAPPIVPWVERGHEGAQSSSIEMLPPGKSTKGTSLRPSAEGKACLSSSSFTKFVGFYKVGILLN